MSDKKKKPAAAKTVAGKTNSGKNNPNKTKKEKQKISLSNREEARRAFIYSEIFNRKY